MSNPDRTTVPNPKPVLEYPCGTPPAAGETVQIAPGVHWIRMPMPFALTHINLWAIEDDEGWAIVDSGLQTPQTIAAWESLFTGPMAGRPVTRVIATHMHPDHIGMAGWLTRRFGCRLWMTRLEYLTCRVLVADTGREAPEEGIRFYREAGWDQVALDYYRKRFGNYGKMASALPESYRRLHDGETIRIGKHEWQVVVGSGHSPEHACLYCPELKLMLSGDQVLPSISSNVSVFPTEPDADPLGEWLASLDKIARIVPNDVLVLPAHNEPFRGLHERLMHLAGSHGRSLERLREALAEPKRVVDVFSALFHRPITSNDPGQLGLATGESIAHLNYLVKHGEAVRRMGDDGAWRYQMVGNQ